MRFKVSTGYHSLYRSTGGAQPVEGGFCRIYKWTPPQKHRDTTISQGKIYFLLFFHWSLALDVFTSSCLFSFFWSPRPLRLISSENPPRQEIFQDDQEARHYTPIAGAVSGSVDGVPGVFFFWFRSEMKRVVCCLGGGKVTTAQRGFCC